MDQTCYIYIYIYISNINLDQTYFRIFVNEVFEWIISVMPRLEINSYQ